MKKSISLSYLSWKSLKYNKRKTAFVIITISLSVCLLMVIMQYLYSSRQRNIEAAASDTGAYHAVYTDLSEWQTRQIKGNKKIREVTFVSERDGKTGVLILLKSDISSKSVLRDIENRIGLQAGQIHWNIPYLDAADVGIEVILQMICVFAGLLLSAAIVIYNIFNIYVLQDIRLFGTMRAAGFEGWQLKRFLRMEGVVTGCVGSLLGVLLGTVFSALLLPVLGHTQSNAGAIKGETTLGIVALSFLAGVFIVLTGIQKPLNAAAKMSVTQAMGYCPDDGLKHREKTGVRKNQIRLWDLCRINLRGNRKKNRWAILSLVTTGVLFLLTASIIKSMDLENMADNSIRGDFSLQLAAEEGRNKASLACLSPEVIWKIEKLDGVTGVHPMMYDRLVWNDDDAKKYVHLTEEFEELGIGYEDIDSIIYGYDDTFMKECLSRLNDAKISLEDMQENDYAIAVNNGVSDFKVNDTILLKNSASKDGVTKFRIVGILTDNITSRGYSGAGNDFIIHQDRFAVNQMDSRIQRACVTVKQSEKEAVKKILEQLTNSQAYLELVCRDELMADYAQERNALRTSSYSLVALLFCISIMNLLNTTLSNILSRKREMGMLEAIGLTRKQENRMFQTEGLVLVLVSLAGAVLLGIPLGYAGFFVFKKSASYAIYKLPVEETLALLLAFIGILFAVTRIAVNWLGKKSIIEKISQEDL